MRTLLASLLAAAWMPLTCLAVPRTVPAQAISAFATVNGVKLHYLDWGGAGPAMLFLPGAGHSAYIFSDIAPQFTDSFRVLALTRRGHGRSDKPRTGYDTGTLVEDIRQFLDALKIRQVILVGHSLAGDELTRFAGMYPSRVVKLVYLDAAYDRSELRESVILYRLSEVFALVAPSKQDLASIDSYRSWLQRKRYGFWSNALEADMHEIVSSTPDGVTPTMPGDVGQAIARGTEESRPDYTMVKAPALSLYAISSMSTFFWLTPEVDPEIRKKAHDVLDAYVIPDQRKQIERFRREVARGKVVELPDASHFLFIDRQDDVVREMRAFLLDK